MSVSPRLSSNTTRRSSGELPPFINMPTPSRFTGRWRTKRRKKERRFASYIGMPTPRRRIGALSGEADSRISSRRFDHIQFPRHMIDRAMLMGQAVEQPDRFQMPRPDVKLQVASQILSRHIRRPTLRDGMRGDDLIHMPQPQLLCEFQHARQFPKIDSIACHPGCENERQARQFLPCLAEVELMRGILRLLTDYFVANEQLGDIGRKVIAAGRAAMKIEIDDSRPNSIADRPVLRARRRPTYGYRYRRPRRGFHRLAND